MSRIQFSLRESKRLNVQKLVDNIVLAPNGASILYIDVSDMEELTLYANTSSTYTLNVYPNFSGLNDDTMLPAIGLVGLASNVSAPAVNRSNAYHISRYANNIFPCKTIRIMFQSTDGVNSNTMNLWMVSK